MSCERHVTFETGAATHVVMRYVCSAGSKKIARSIHCRLSQGETGHLFHIVLPCVTLSQGACTDLLVKATCGLASNCLVIGRCGCSPSLAETKCDTLCVLRKGTKKETVHKIDRQDAPHYAQHCSTSIDNNHTVPVQAHYFLSVYFLYFLFLMHLVIIFLYSCLGFLFLYCHVILCRSTLQYYHL